MPIIISTIQAALPRVVQKNDGTSFTLYEVTDGDGNKYVARKDVFTVAQAFVGQVCELVTRSEQKGSYLNHYLDHVAAAGQAAGIAPGQPQYPQAQAQYNPVVQAQQAQPAQNGSARVYVADEKDRMICRQTAGKVAAVFSKTPDEFWHNLGMLATYFETGATPHALPTLGSPQALQFAQQVVAHSAPHPDQDIPF